MPRDPPVTMAVPFGGIILWPRLPSQPEAEAEAEAVQRDHGPTQEHDYKFV